MPAGAGGLGQQRRESLYPAVDGDVVSLDTTLGEEFLDVAVGQSEAQVPADRQDNHVGWEAEAGEGRPRGGSRARRRVLIPAVSLLGRGRCRCNSAHHFASAGASCAELERKKASTWRVPPWTIMVVADVYAPHAAT